ncbi:serpin family protein [Actinomadura hibisca]|uniref:serpin family protein n=1 Tax=Actinomadura hibisca TaxID=68565 RepID=UPI000835FD68|nr:serpin family protein [Actinomadura hibisca]
MFQPAPINALTARWAATCTGESTVQAGVGAWPLLAFLAAGATGEGRAELEEAVGVDAASAAQAGRELLDLLAASPGVRAALGVWTHREALLRPSWTDALAPNSHGVLSGVPETDQAHLDAWASEQTGGLIPAMPVTVDERTLLVLASALAVRTTWLQPFDESDGYFGETWAHFLFRMSQFLDRVRVAETPAGPVTMLRVMGRNGIDVHLALGEADRAAADVLPSAIDVLARRHRTVPADSLPIGTSAPGLEIRHARSYRPEDRLAVTVPRFSLKAEHDLLKLPEVFGLTTVSDTERGHFPGISDAPLAVQRAGQNAMTNFTAKGFEAAAVTVIAAAAGGMPPPPPYRVKEAEFHIDRPFGFLAVHRRTGLILTAGWVADGEPYDD